jgi:3',5'-cyclic AMP phosphodiesterase CpdA
VAPTIEEHQKVIRKLGWCWWGWWKRPSEDGRSDIWNDLAIQTADGQAVPVGLFHSGSGSVYEAFVTDVIKPSGATGITAEDTIRVPPQESEHVPLYYRESPFSRAWIKITRIEPRPIDFFGNYSFEEAPKLPNYAEPLLRRFAGKKIANAEELRGMDTTIWRIRPSLPADSSEQILLSVQALTDSVSVDVVRCRANAILHLTDMHFAVDANRAQHVWRYDSEAAQTRHTMVEAITSALGQRKIGLVIATGDFTFIGESSEFNEARTGILHLLGILDLSPDHLVIIPGNHDIQWTTSAVYDHNAGVVQAPPAAKRNYEEFYRQLLRHEPNRHLAMGRRFALPCGLTIEVCGLNSSSLETGKHFLAGMGRIDEGAFAEIAQQLGWANAENQTLALRLLAIHHHLALTEDLEPAEGYGKGYGLAVDAVRIQRLAARKGVHLALHGHKHRSFIWRSTVYELPELTQTQYRLGELSIVGGGSAGSIETDGSSNYFNVLAIESGKLTLQIFRSLHRGAFDLIQEWDAELSLSKASGGIKLGDWNKVR